MTRKEKALEHRQKIYDEIARVFEESYRRTGSFSEAAHQTDIYILRWAMRNPQEKQLIRSEADLFANNLESIMKSMGMEENTIAEPQKPNASN